MQLRVYTGAQGHHGFTTATCCGNRFDSGKDVQVTVNVMGSDEGGEESMDY